MALVEFQTVLGRMLREQKSGDPLQGLNLDASESQYFETLRATAGFRFCASIQRSWCIGRAAKSAYFTFLLMPEEKRQPLLNEWVDTGAGTSSFYDAEAESFLDFLSERLSDPSHELSMCQFERATQRANIGTNFHLAPDPTKLDDTELRLRRGTYASLVRFYADPALIMHAIQSQQPLPPVSADSLVIMLSPGLPQLWYTPSEEDLAVWETLESPAPTGTLLSRGFSLETLERLTTQGTLEYAN